MGFGNPSEIVGKDDFDFSATRGEAESFRADDQEVMRRGEPCFKIREHQEANGEQRWLKTNKVPLRKAVGEVIGIR
jgi:hypothetical protein